MEGNYFAILRAWRRSNATTASSSLFHADGKTRRKRADGSLGSIAGILNEGRNVLGMMPHRTALPESLLGSVTATSFCLVLALQEKEGQTPRP